MKHDDETGSDLKEKIWAVISVAPYVAAVGAVAVVIVGTSGARPGSCREPVMGGRVHEAVACDPPQRPGRQR